MKKFLLAAPLAVVSLAGAYGQAISVNGGAIQGTITDPSGASVPNASIVITSLGEGTSKNHHCRQIGLLQRRTAESG